MSATRTTSQAARAASARRRFEAGAAGELWQRLVVLDVVNQAFLVAATLLLCGFPFLLCVDAVRDRSFVASIARRMGLSDAAAAQVQGLFAPSAQTQSAVTAGSAAFLVVGAIAVAASVQALYARVYGFEPRDLVALWRKPVWVVATVVGSSAVGAVFGLFGPSWQSRALAHVLGAVVATLYFWWSLHFLLERRLSWRYLLPSAVATGLCWLGLGVFSTFFFSSAMLSSGGQYGSIGVVFVLMTWLVALGVVLALGAVLGVVWRERHPLGGDSL